MDKTSIENLRQRVAELEQELKQELQKRIESLQNKINKKRNTWYSGDELVLRPKINNKNELILPFTLDWSFRVVETQWVGEKFLSNETFKKVRQNEITTVGKLAINEYTLYRAEIKTDKKIANLREPGKIGSNFKNWQTVENFLKGLTGADNLESSQIKKEIQSQQNELQWTDKYANRDKKLIKYKVKATYTNGTSIESPPIKVNEIALKQDAGTNILKWTMNSIIEPVNTRGPIIKYTMKRGTWQHFFNYNPGNQNNRQQNRVQTIVYGLKSQAIVIRLMIR